MSFTSYQVNSYRNLCLMLPMDSASLVLGEPLHFGEPVLPFILSLGRTRLAHRMIIVNSTAMFGKNRIPVSK